MEAQDVANVSAPTLTNGGGLGLPTSGQPVSQAEAPQNAADDAQTAVDDTTFAVTGDRGLARLHLAMAQALANALAPDRRHLEGFSAAPDETPAKMAARVFVCIFRLRFVVFDHGYAPRWCISSIPTFFALVWPRFWLF